MSYFHRCAQGISQRYVPLPVPAAVHISRTIKPVAILCGDTRVTRFPADCNKNGIRFTTLRSALHGKPITGFRKTGDMFVFPARYSIVQSPLLQEWQTGCRSPRENHGNISALREIEGIIECCISSSDDDDVLPFSVLRELRDLIEYSRSGKRILSFDSCFFRHSPCCYDNGGTLINMFRRMYEKHAVPLSDFHYLFMEQRNLPLAKMLLKMLDEIFAGDAIGESHIILHAICIAQQTADFPFLKKCDVQSRSLHLQRSHDARRTCANDDAVFSHEKCRNSSVERGVANP